MGTGGVRRVWQAVAAACLAAVFFAPSASATHYDALLAPERICKGQADPTVSLERAARAGVCLHNWARKAAARKASKSRRTRDGRPARGDRGLGASKALVRSAAAKTNDILKCGEFAHEACGRDPFYWHARKGYAVGCFGVGENLFIASEQAATPRAAMAAWLHSDVHRQTLLRSKFRDVGISVRSGLFAGSPVRVWVAHFGYRC